MLSKTKGIVFRLTRYGETSIIVNIFTSQFGLQSYIINGVRTSSPKSKIALYQPLTLLNLVVYHKENANILRIKEAECVYAYRNIGVVPVKSGQAMFINEVLNKAVKDQSHADEICEFIFSALIKLDSLTKGFENFHLVFLIQLSSYLGFGPQNPIEVVGARFIDPAEEKILGELIAADFDTSVKMNIEQRRNVLDFILQFYSSHIDSFGELKSVPVLKEVLS